MSPPVQARRETSTIRARGRDDEGGDSGGATSELAGSEGGYDDEGWRTQSSGASASTVYCGAGSGDCCGGEGRFTALWVDDESMEEEIDRGIGFLVDGPGFRFNDGNNDGNAHPN